jgi:hypothetical protein
MPEPRLTVGFLERFDEDCPTVLMVGGREALQLFTADLLRLADTEGGGLDLKRLGYAEVRGSLSLVVKRVRSYREARGLVNIAAGREPRLDWLLEDEMLREAADKVSSLARLAQFEENADDFRGVSGG